MHGEVFVGIRKKATAALWSKNDRPINFGSRDEAEREIERLVAHGEDREGLEVYVERIPY